VRRDQLRLLKWARSARSEWGFDGLLTSRTHRKATAEGLVLTGWLARAPGLVKCNGDGDPDKDWPERDGYRITDAGLRALAAEEGE
jgi:hypothetical protein